MIYKFNAILIKIPIMFSAKIEKSILKFTWNLKGLQIAKTIFKKKNKTAGLTLLDFNTYLKGVVIKTLW